MSNRLIPDQISPASPLIHIPTQRRSDLPTATESTAPLSSATYVSIPFQKAAPRLYKLESRESSSNAAIPVCALGDDQPSLTEWMEKLNWAFEQGGQ